MESQGNFDRVGSVLIGKGNFLSFVLILIPFFYDLSVRFGVGEALILTGSASLLFIFLLLLLLKFAFRSTMRYFAAMALLVAGYAILYVALQTPLNPYAFVGVLPAGLMTYAYGAKGRTLGHLLVLNITVLNYLLQIQTVGASWASFSQLISYLATLALLIEFVAVTVELSKQEMREVNEYNQRIRIEHQRLLSLINNIGDAVIATDFQGRIQTYNGAALELLDTNISLTGKQLASVFDLIDKDGQAVDLIAEARGVQRTIRRNDLRLRYAPNDTANLYLNVTPIKVGYGQQSERGFTLIMRDITKEKSLEEERDEFVSVVSHELRTPVTITEGKVSNALLLLNQDETDREKLNKSLSQAHHQVVYLSNMINDLSSLARAERAESQMDLESIDPNDLLKEIGSSYSIEAKGQGLEFEVIPGPGDMPRLYTSRLYLLEVLQNFVTNSLKYTREGKITVSVKPVAEQKVEFRVSDTGIGISKSDQKHLFEKFFRSEDYRTRESNGTGLGLYITHKLIAKLQGQVEIDSELDHGSTFKLTVGSLKETSRRSSQPA